MNGERYLANTHKKEVHDLDNENTAPNKCEINKIIDAGHDRPYTSLKTAHDDGYDNCAHCIGGSTR
jgi:hypothetical protein